MTNIYATAMDKALEESPPEIVWRKNNKGILTAVSVNDPHADSQWGPRDRIAYLDYTEVES